MMPGMMPPVLNLKHDLMQRTKKCRRVHIGVCMCVCVWVCVCVCVCVVCVYVRTVVSECVRGGEMRTQSCMILIYFRPTCR